MPGHSRPKDGVASLAYVPGIDVFSAQQEDVDGRDKPGHDELGSGQTGNALNRQIVVLQRFGISTVLPFSIASARAIRRRVECGMITSSM